MERTEFTIPPWVRSKKTKVTALGAAVFFAGVAVGGSSSQTPNALVASPASTVTVTIPGDTHTVEKAGPTVTMTERVMVTVAAVSKPAATSAAKPRAATAPAPLVQKQDVYYANCTEARAAGVTPIYRGEPGYAARLDRDNDGVACET